MGPLTSAPTGIDETEISEFEEAALASLPRPINWYAILCRFLGVLVIGSAIWGVWVMAHHPQARGAMIEWVTFGKAH